ncbi:ATP-binding protein [Paenibacillus sp. JSM ZJ436]|uniref:ATP-binding protein n=1 Tax=Paenibacillus sp. JSM ZJ436 TaxID=3376190 RepID=UPI0037B2440B
MHDPNTEADRLRQTIEEMSDQIIRAREREEQVLGEFTAMNNELVTLQRRLAKSNAELKRSRLEAEQANEAKGRLLAVISHEIRTPMNAIMGMAEMLEQPGLTDVNRQSVGLIRDSAALLIHMINDLLDLSKIDAGKMELRREAFDLHVILDHSARLLQDKLENNGNRLSMLLDERLERQWIGDAGRINQVMLNLLGNANKFTQDGQIMIRVKPAEHEGQDENQSLVRFEVEDTGMGISAEDQKNLFTPYMQTDEGGSPEYGGTGLGLSICKSLVELMRGRIGVSSEEGRGTLFWFQIPLEPAVGQESGNRSVEALRAAYAEQQPLQTTSRDLSVPVLLVEDNDINRQVVGMQLRKLGLQQVDWARNGLEAVQKARENTYALILMDHMMPKLSGAEAAAQIRAEEQQLGKPAVPLVAMTGSTDERARRQCMDAGMNDFVSKPVHAQALAAILEAYLPEKTAQSDRPVLDYKTIHEIIEIQEDGSQELLALLFQMYQEDMPDKMERLHKLLQQGRSAEAAAAAHDMKSGSLSLGVQEFSRLLAEIEALCKAGRLEQGLHTFGQLQPAYEEACGSLNALLESQE